MKTHIGDAKNVNKSINKGVAMTGVGCLIPDAYLSDGCGGHWLRIEFREDVERPGPELLLEHLLDLRVWDALQTGLPAS